MSEDDFKDIQEIAKMVEPHLAPMQPIQPDNNSVQKVEAESLESTPAAATELEEFKKLISTITQRIDDILQKINSSKECAEQVDAKWKSKSTFNNMKRQIYQLKTDRLAQKLCKNDLKDDDKKLVDELKKYLKDLTKQNDALIIEDDFGLPASHAQEKKHLKQTKEFLNSCDDYIDNLMPLLEKFLQKWDPEALKIAKESEDRSKKALKDATDATARKGSADARPYAANQSGGGRYNATSQSGQYPSYSGYYPDYDQAGGYGNDYQFPENDFGSKSAGAEGSGSTEPSAKAKSEVNAQAPTAKTKKKDNDIYNDVIDELNGHLTEDFDLQHEDNFITFMQDDIADYPNYALIVNGVGPTKTIPSPKDPQPAINLFTTNSTREQEDAWIDGKAPFPVKMQTGGEIQGFKPYTIEIKNKLEQDFTKEFRSLRTILNKAKNNISKMSEEELRQLPKSDELITLENRLKRYKTTFENVLPTLKQAFDTNTQTAITQNPAIVDQFTVPKYTKEHDNFVDELKLKIGSEVDELINTIRFIKSNARRTAKKKQNTAETTAA